MSCWVVLITLAVSAGEHFIDEKNGKVIYMVGSR
jgi:hypothetical protein